MKDKLKSVREFLEQKFSVKLKLEEMEIKLAQMKLADGVTVLEFDSLEVGKEVFIVSENGNVPLPIGEYELEDGQMLEVYEDGIIGEVAAKEEEKAPMEEAEPEAEVPVEASTEPTQTAKKVIRSTIEEQHFASQEEVNELKSIIAELKEQLKVKEDVKEVVELEETPKPISFNPENVQKMEQIKLTAQKTMSNRDRILNTIYNNK
jgi:hypothetical protein